MIIYSQDGDSFKMGAIYWECQVVHGTFMGYNIYGIPTQMRIMVNILKKFRTLLGTYDTREDAAQIVAEINRLYNKGVDHYTMPEPADEPETVFDKNMGDDNYATDY